MRALVSLDSYVEDLLRRQVRRRSPDSGLTLNDVIRAGLGLICPESDSRRAPWPYALDADRCWNVDKALMFVNESGDAERPDGLKALKRRLSATLKLHEVQRALVIVLGSLVKHSPIGRVMAEA